MAEPRPRGDRVVVKLLEDREQAGGIVIPEGVQAYPSRGVVVYVGPGFRKSDGEYLPLDLHRGDEVLFFRQEGLELSLDGEKLILLHDQHVLLVTQEAFIMEQEVPE